MSIKRFRLKVFYGFLIFSVKIKNNDHERVFYEAKSMNKI